MGYQTSRIIWGKKYLDEDDESEAYLTPVTNWQYNVIYNSGCLVVYYDTFFTSSNFTLAVYQCQVEETVAEPSSYTESEWKKLPGIKFIETARTSYTPLPDSKAEQVLNAPRVVYNPGSKVIIEDGVVDEKIVYHVYECDRKTNVKYEGFDRSKWHLVKQHVGRLFQPVDHKEVYYDDGKNKHKYHYAMYYVPEDPGTSEEEICEFNEFTEYSKGEYALDYGSKLAEEKREPDTLFKYVYHIPSMPTRQSPYKEGYDYIQPRPSGSSDRDQLFNGTWEKIKTIEFFDKLKAYNKGDWTIFNQYYIPEEEGEETDKHEGRGWYIGPVIPFQENYIYKYGQYCLHRIKNSENQNISDSDCEKLIETGDYELVELNPDAPEEYKIYDKKPTSIYGESIESNKEVYGLYKYIGSMDKRQGELFTNSNWDLIATARMWVTDIEKYNNGFSMGEYVIAPYAGSYALFRATTDIKPDYYFTEKDYNKWAGAGKPISSMESFMSYGYFAPYMQVENRKFKGVRATPLDVDTTPLAKTIWDMPTQKYYDSATGYRVFEAIKDIPADTDFSNNNWKIVTQEKMASLDLYGWIWRKYEFGSGGTPYGSDLALQSLSATSIGPHNKVRFNNLAIYLGGNTLSVGSVSTNFSTHNFTNFKFYTVGNSAYYYSTDTFYIKAPLLHGWYMFSLYNILIPSGLDYKDYPTLSGGNFWPDNRLKFIFELENNTFRIWVVRIVDLTNKHYSIAKKIMTFRKEQDVKNEMKWYDNYTVHAFIDVEYDKTLLYLPLGVSHSGDHFATGAFIEYFTTRDINDNIIARIPGYDGTEDLESYGVLPGLDYNHISKVEFNYSMTHDDTLFEYLWDNLRNQGILDVDSHTASFSYWVFVDGWTGDENSPGTEYYEREMSLRFINSLTDLGVYGLKQHTETEFDPQYIERYDRWATDVRHIIIEWEEIGTMYYALYVAHNDLLKDEYGVVRPESDPDHAWIDRDPIYTQKYFYSQDRKVLYVLRGFSGYFSSDLDPGGMRACICYYEVFFMDIYYANVKRSLKLSETKWFNYEQYAYIPSTDTYVPISLATLSNTFMLSQHHNGGFFFNIVYIFDDLKTYTNENDECVLSGGFICLVNARHDDTGLPTNSSGMRLIPLHDARYEYCQYPPEYEVKPVDSLEVFFYPIPPGLTEVRIRSLWRLCHIEYIPYYGGDTCHLHGIEKDVKFITIDIANYMKHGDYYFNKMSEYEANNCLYYSFNLFDHPEIIAPSVNQSSGGMNTSSSDIIINTVVSISNKIDNETVWADYNICIVLPFFKTLYANNAMRMGAGQKIYDPATTGAFFWLSSDVFSYRAEPQYGGTEDGAPGFSGW